MLEDTPDESMPQLGDHSNALERALAAAARQQFEHDSRRRHFLDESRRKAAQRAETFKGDSPALLTALPSGREPTGRFTGSVGWNMEQAGGRIARESDPALHLHPQLGTASHAMPDPGMRATAPFQSSLELSRVIAAHAGLAEACSQLGPTRLMRTSIGQQTRDIRSDDMRARDTANDPFAQVALKYTVPLHEQIETTFQERSRFGPGAELTTALADALTPGEDYSQPDTGVDERAIPFDKSQSRGRDRGFQIPGLGDHDSHAKAMLTRAIAGDWPVGAPEIGSASVGFGDLIGHGGHRANPSDPRRPSLQDGGWKSDDGAASGAVTPGRAQEAMAAAVDELERLRTAVRRNHRRPGEGTGVSSTRAARACLSTVDPSAFRESATAQAPHDLDHPTSSLQTFLPARTPLAGRQPLSHR